MHEKLSSGLWIAEGFNPAVGPQPQPINPELWRSLRFEPYEQAAVGSGYKFVNLLISSGRPSTVSQVPGAVLRQLVSWIKEQVADGRGPLRKADLLKEAREAIPDFKITPHMLQRGLDQTQVPEGFLFKGRPGG